MIRRNFLKVLALFGAKATLTATSFDETKIKAIELNECYIVGLQYYDGKDFNADTVKFLTLKSEPTNEYDENAIEVIGGKQNANRSDREKWTRILSLN